MDRHFFKFAVTPFIDMDKDGFVGRRVLLDADRPTLPRGIKYHNVTPAIGECLFDGKGRIGQIAAGPRSPYLDRGIDYLRFDQVGDCSGDRLTLITHEIQAQACDLLELLFYDAGKNIARGLDTAIPTSID
ncbi:MAG: hypothetical protein AAF530_12455 [Pseudomonadota bacterium]